MFRRAPSGPAYASTGTRRPVLKYLVLAVGLTLFYLLVFVVALGLAAPAQTIARVVTLPPHVQVLSGRVVEGRALLNGGYALGWKWRPSDLLDLAIGVDITLSGSDTRAVGRVRYGMSDLAISSLRGRAGPGLLVLAAPDLSCSSTAAMDVDRAGLGVGGAFAEGVITLTAGRCTRGSREAAVPALRIPLITKGTDAVARVLTDDGSATQLGSLRVTGDRWVILRVEPAGAERIPGMPSSAATVLEYPF